MDTPSLSGKLFLPLCQKRQKQQPSEARQNRGKLCRNCAWTHLSEGEFGRVWPATKGYYEYVPDSMAHEIWVTQASQVDWLTRDKRGAWSGHDPLLLPETTYVLDVS